MRSRKYLFGVLLCALLLGPTGCGSSDKETSQSATPITDGSAVSAPTGAESATYTTVDVQTTYERLNAGEGAQLVDVREPEEWATTGVGPGSVLIPLAQVESRAPAELAADKPVYVICNSGNRSRVAADTLLRLGYAEVYNVDGGIQAWLRAGLPVETYKP